MSEVTSTIKLGIDQTEAVTHLKALRTELTGFKEDLAKLRGTSSGMKTLEAEIAKLKTELAGMSKPIKQMATEAEEGAHRVSKVMSSWRTSIDGVATSYREASTATVDQVKAAAALENKQRDQIRLGNEIIALNRRQRSEQMALGSSMVPGSYTQSAEYRYELAKGSEIQALLRRQALERREERRRQESEGSSMVPGSYTQSAEYRYELAKGNEIQALLRRQALERREERRRQEAEGASMVPGSYTQTAEYRYELAKGSEIQALLRRQALERREERRRQEAEGASMAPGAYRRTAEYREQIEQGNAHLAAMRQLRQAENAERQLGLAQVAAQAENERRIYQQLQKDKRDHLSLAPEKYNAAGKQGWAYAQMQQAGVSSGMLDRLFPAGAASAAQDLDKHLKNVASSGNQSTKAIKHWTDASNEAHSAARGLAGGLNMLWVTWGSVVPLVAGAALTGALRSMYEEGKKVEYQLAFLKGLGGANVSTHELESAVAGSMFGVKEGADGLRALAQSGLTARDALATLPQILSLATVGETTVANAAFAATGVMKAFGLSIDEIGRISDVMSKAAAASNASVDDMMQAFKYASVAASRYGESLEDTGAALAVLSERNIKGSMAGTAHMNMLRELYTPTARAAEAYKKLGVDVQELQRKGMGANQMLVELRKATAALDATSLKSFMDAVGGERGSREFAVMLSGDFKAFDKMKEKLEESKDFTKAVMVELANTVEGGSARLSQAWTGALARGFKEAQTPLQTFLDALANGLRSEQATEVFVRLANGLVNLSRALADNGKAITFVVGAYAGLKILQTFVGVIEGMTAKWAAATAATAANTAAQVANNAAQTGAVATLARFSSGVGLVTSGIGALIGVGATLWSFWELFGKKVDTARNAQDAINNSIRTTVGLLDREIERLEQRIRLQKQGKNPDDSNNQFADTIEGQRQAALAEAERFRNAKKIKTLTEDSYALKGPDGKDITLNKWEFQKQSQKAEADLYEVASKVYKRANDQALLDKNTAVDRLGQAVDNAVDVLARRRATTNDPKKLAEIEAAIKSVSAYKGVTDIRDSTQAEGIIKALQPFSDAGGAHINFQERPDRKAERQAQNLAKAEIEAEKRKYKLKEQIADQESAGERRLLDARRQANLVAEATYQDQLENLAEKQLKDRISIEEEGSKKIRQMMAERKSKLEPADLTRYEEELRLSRERVALLQIELKYHQQVASIREQGKVQRINDAGSEAIEKLKADYVQRSNDRTSKRGTEFLYGADKDAAIAALQEGDRWQQEINKKKAESLKLTGDELTAAQNQISALMTQKFIHEQMAATEARKLYEDTNSWAYGAEKAWASYRDSALTNGQIVEQGLKNSFQSVESAFVKFTQTGKLSFRGLVSDMSSQIAALMAKEGIRQLLSLALQAAGTFFGPQTSSIGPAQGSTMGPGVQASGAYVTPISTAHTGSIVGLNEGGSKSVDPSVFAGAPRFHTGGIVAGEVPIIARRGEGVFTEGQMKKLAPVGTGDTNVSVSVTVMSDGTQKRTESGDQGKELARLVEAGVMQVIEREKRPGGLLYA